MHGKQNPRSQPTLLAGRLLGDTTWIMNALGTTLIFAVMLLVNADIIFRFAFSAPIRGVAEIVSISIVGIVFLQLPHTLRVGQVTRAELLLGYLERKHPRVALAALALFSLLGMAVFATLAVATWRPFREAYDMGHYLGSPGDFTVPTWPMFILIVLGAAAVALQYAAFAINHIIAILTFSQVDKEIVG